MRHFFTKPNRLRCYLEVMRENLWNVKLPEARKIQEQLRAEVSIKPIGITPKIIAGVDVSMNRFSNTLYAGWIVLSLPDLIEIDHGLAVMDTTFPYVPGFLSFREIPALLKAFEKLKVRPDIVMVDGQGIAHPRRLGIATHLGLVLDIPTFGCAKSRLYGVGDDPGDEAGSVAYLHDPKSPKETIGAWLRTRDHVKPVLISPGNRITLEESLELTRDCVRGYRIPEPSRCAHELVNSFRKGEIS